MTSKTLVLSLVLCAGATLFVGCSAEPRTEHQKPEAAPQASASLPPDPPADETPEPSPPPDKPVVALKPSPAPTPAAKKSVPDKPEGKPDNTPVPVADAILKRWKVPPLAVPKGENHYPMTNGAAINDDGTRVIIDNHPAVDIWDTAKVSYTRVQLQPDWAWGYNSIIAQDASRFYARNDKAKKVEVYNAKGTLTGSGPQVGFAPPHGLKRIGYDFAPKDYVMGSRPNEGGIYVFDPETAALRNVVPIKDIWDVEMCRGLVRLPGGDFLVCYTGGVNNRRGIYTITKDGTFTNIPGIPSKDLKVVDDMTLSPDGRYLALRGGDRLEVWDVKDKKLVVDWRQEYRSPRAVRFAGDGRLAVLSVKTSLKDIVTSGLTGGYVNNSARLDVLDIPSLRVAGQLSLAEFEALIPAFAFSPNGKRLVVADWKQVALVDVERAFPDK
jgi:hypothetical protein